MKNIYFLSLESKLIQNCITGDLEGPHKCQVKSTLCPTVGDMLKILE